MAVRSLLVLLTILSSSALIACSSSSSPSSSPTDAGHHDASPNDAEARDARATDAKVSRDASIKDAGFEAGPPGLTCAKLLGCDMPCTDDACTNACYAMSTGVAQGLFNALNDCIEATCASACAGADAGSSCSTCQEQAATGACITLLLTCEQDKDVGPADPDGGSVVAVDAGRKDAGKELNCGGLVSCEGACGDAGASCASTCVGQSTPTAESLANALAHCLDMACPAVDGGSCASPGSTCTGCRTQAEFDPMVCGTAFSTCQDDTSNGADAGTSPVGLQGGTVLTLASGLDQPQVVLVQNDDVYFSQVTSTGPVSRAAFDDAGSPGTISASQPYPMGLAIDATNVYAWNSGSFSGSTTVNEDDGSVVQLPLAGGSPLTLATGIEAAYAAPYLNAIAVANGKVYWVAGASGNDGAIMSTGVGVVGANVVYSHQLFPEAVVTDGTNLYWANWGTFDSSGNYNNDGTVLQGPVGGGTVTTLASGQSAPAAIAIDGSNVYWTNAGKLAGDNLPAPGTGSVMQAPIGGGVTVTLAKNEPIPLGIAVGSGVVYWNEYTLSGPGQIVSVPVGGGASTPLVGGLQDPFGLTVAGTTLVWSDSPPTQASSGKILALTLP
jgi:hypothetical protein